MTAKVVSFINLKGGVGKSTLALTIGEFLAFSSLNRKVLLIDLDAQTNLSYALVSKPTRDRLETEKKTVYHMFRAALDGQPWDINAAMTSNCSNILNNKNLKALVTTEELGQLDEDILGMLEQKQQINVDFRRILKESLTVIKNYFDWIIIDFPPSLSTITSNAIIASDHFVVPVTPEFLSLQGLRMIQDRIGQLINRLPYGNEINIDFAGSILNRVDVRRSDAIERAEQIYSQLQGGYNPFHYWLGDWQPLFVVSDYDYLTYHQGKPPYYAYGSKFENPWHKYGNWVRRQTPHNSFLRREYANSFYVRDRIFHLVREFESRCR